MSNGMAFVSGSSSWALHKTLQVKIRLFGPRHHCGECTDNLSWEVIVCKAQSSFLLCVVPPWISGAGPAPQALWDLLGLTFRMEGRVSSSSGDNQHVEGWHLYLDHVPARRSLLRTPEVKPRCDCTATAGWSSQGPAVSLGPAELKREAFPSQKLPLSRWEQHSE